MQRAFCNLAIVMVFGWLNEVVDGFEQNYFSICVMAKDELDLPEWIEYHHRMGADKIYLYDHDSSPPLLNNILSYVMSGLVEYQYVTTAMKDTLTLQETIYIDCVTKHGKKHNFMAFIDVDEFIVLKDRTKSIPDVLRIYEHFGGLVLNWRIFGSSGHRIRPQNGVLASYNMCCDHESVKTILNTKHQNDVSSLRFYPHNIHNTVNNTYESEARYVNVNPSYQTLPDGNLNFEIVFGDVNRNALYDVIYINHYYIKSLEDFELKNKRRIGRETSHAANRLLPLNLTTIDLFNEYSTQNCGFLKMPSPRII